MSYAPCYNVTVRLELWRRETGQGKEVGVAVFSREASRTCCEAEQSVM